VMSTCSAHWVQEVAEGKPQHAYKPSVSFDFVNIRAVLAWDHAAAMCVTN
jgi:hypothetical protein